MPTAAEPLLQVRDLRTWFLTDSGPVRAVDGVSFDVHAGETLGVVGESGSGKSVCAKSIMRLLDEPARIVGGSILFKGRDLAHLDDEAIRAVRGREIAMVFQDPMTSLNPVLRIARQLIEAMTAHGRNLHLRVAIDYSSRDSIMRAAQLAGGAPTSREQFAALLAQVNHDPVPVRDVDLLIRSGGEQRLSDFLLWECAYAELLFVPKMWPEFTADDLAEALEDFRGRNRRFGLAPEQVAS